MLWIETGLILSLTMTPSVSLNHINIHVDVNLTSLLWKAISLLSIALCSLSVNSRSTDILPHWQKWWTLPRERGHGRLLAGRSASLAPSPCRFITLLIWTEQRSTRGHYSTTCWPLFLLCSFSMRCRAVEAPLWRGTMGKGGNPLL